MIKTLTKAQKLEHEKFRIPRSVQDSIPIRRIFADGIFQVGNQYSKTWSFTDINYAIAGKEDKTAMFLDYSELLNALDSGASAKITIYNRRINKAEFERSVLLPDKDDGLDEYRHEFNQMLTAQVTGTSNSIVRERYLTVSVVKRNPDEARSYFARVGTDLVTHLAQLSSVANELTLTERLHIFRDFFKAGEQAAAEFNIHKHAKRGQHFKDWFCPDSMEFAADHFKLDARYGRVLYLQDYASYIKDSFVSELCDLDRDLMLSIDILPVPTDEAARQLQSTLLGVETNVANWQRRQNANNNFTATIPYDMENLLQTIDAERLFQRPPLLSMGKEIAAGVTDTEQKVEQIILEVTEQCNFRCKYCVYSEDFSGNRDFGNRRMPTEIAFKAIDWALENSGAKLAITFYGGEPLLNFKLMKAVIERSQAKRGNKEIVYSFTSNMSLMTREIATYLAQVPNLYIMASIDGPRTVHDAYRVYANDAPTFEDSIGGLRILADAYAGSHMPVNINAVLTPPFGFEKLEQVNAYFESLDWLPATCHVNITYPSYGTCPGLDEYYDKITGNPKYALHGMCNPLMIWQQRKAETDGLDAYKARNIYYHSIFDDLVKINNRIIVDEPTLRRGLNGCVPV